MPDEETWPERSGSDVRGTGARLLWMVLVLAAGILLLVPAAVRLVRRRRRLRSGDGEAAYREVVDTMVDLRLGSESSTPRSTLAVVSALVAAGDGAESAPVEEAMARILRAVEWQRYGSPGAAPLRPEPDLTPAPSPEGEQGGGVLVAERQGASPSDTRPGALAGDMRIVRRALARRAGWVRRRGGSRGAPVGDHGTGGPGGGPGRLGRELGCATVDPTRSTGPQNKAGSPMSDAPLDQVKPGCEPFAAEGSGDNARIGVVLVHGFTGSPDSTVPWAKYLNERGYTVNAIRLPGHGTTWQDANTKSFADLQARRG